MTQRQERALMEALRRNLTILRELAMRYEVSSFRGAPRTRGRAIHRPQDAGEILIPEMEQLTQEQFRVLLIDTKNRLVGQHLVYQGNVNTAVVRAAEVFREAVIEAAPRVILAHNHPSGDPEPSREDVTMTGFLLEAGRILGVQVLDHLVVGQGTVVSIRGRGLPTGVTWPD